MLTRFFDEPFRVFFLAAALSAALHPLLWVAYLSGVGPELGGSQPLVWHAHEMIFGFAAALVAGFLLTAVPNWTGHQVGTPNMVAVLLAAWLGARIAMFVPSGYSPVPGMLLSALFFPLLFVVLAHAIFTARNRRNYPVLLVIAGLALAGIAVQLAHAGLVPWHAGSVLRGTVDVLLVLMVFIGSRVIPFFTRRRLPGADVRDRPVLAWIAFGLVLATVLAGWTLPGSLPAAAMALLAGVVLLVLGWQWRPLATLGEPMLWILHLGWTWLAVALLLRGLPFVPGGVALHALTMGGLGCLAIGMMTRVALGHSGRPLHADAWMQAAFVLVALAAPVRIAFALLPSGQARFALLLAAVCWSAGFALYAARFLPVFVRPRLVPA